MRIKPDPTPLKAACRWISASTRPLKWMLLGAVSALLVLGQGFGAKWWRVPPRGQPAQMWSRVDYDPKLNDPFFKANQWRHPDYDSKGTPLDEGRKEQPRFKQTAKCYSSVSGGWKHLVEFCEGRLLDVNTTELLIHHSGPGYDDALRVRIRNGMFTCQYWTLFRRRAASLLTTVWMTKRQELTLDKKVYRKGDVIKGRIDFECVHWMSPPNVLRHSTGKPSTIKLYGVFKTIVE